jgi:hypothetical protein
MSDDAEKGGLDPAPTTPTEDKDDPEAGTGSADKRSEDNNATEQPGSGGDITR